LLLLRQEGDATTTNIIYPEVLLDSSGDSIADPLPPSLKLKSEVEILQAPSQSLIGQIGALKLRPWPEL
jgi:hypothetical protein